jgi:energy-coupling factor transport system ATP-binding protein
VIEISQLTFTYPNSHDPALLRVNLMVQDSEFIVLLGPTGSGKTTLLMTLAGLAPSFTGGRLSGSIRINGQECIGARPQDLSDLIGYVSQQPEGSFVAETVIEELAFGLEQAGAPEPQMRERISEIADRLNITEILDRKVTELSGGEQQRVAIAAALVGGQKILLLDEPTSALDAEGAKAVTDLLADLSTNHGYAIIASEHRIDQIGMVADSVAVVNLDGTVKKFENLEAANSPLLFQNENWNLKRTNPDSKIVVVMGPNGSGKTTLLWKIQHDFDAVMVPQKASDLLFLQSLSAEFNESDSYSQVPKGSTSSRFADLVGRIDPSIHPRDLSAGQQLALAVAVQTVREAPLLVLDEPTRGLDQTARHKLATQLRALQSQGQNIILATHDSHFAEQIADEIVTIDYGVLAKPIQIAGDMIYGDGLSEVDHV